MKLILIIAQILIWTTTPLQENNFKGTAYKPSDIAYSTTEIVVIPVVKEDGIYFDVIASFNEDDSFINVDSQYISRILNHEQQHFNITELFARKIRQSIQIYQGTSTQRELDKVKKIVTILLQEWEAMEIMYDRQTKHSINKEEQILWDNMIKDMLKKSVDYQQNSYNKKLKV